MVRHCAVQALEGGAFGYLGGLAEGAAALAPTAGEVAGTLAGVAGVGAAATAGLAVGIAGGAAPPRPGGAPRHWTHLKPGRPSGGRRTSRKETGFEACSGVVILDEP